MPLFMDFHIIPDVTIEEVKLAHIADLAIQEKYNVIYHQFWLNEEAGTLFCLIEGPDKETCARVHEEAHGNIACQITEVESGFFDIFLGSDQQIDHGLVRNKDGSLDQGYRYVMVTSIIGNTRVLDAQDYKGLKIPDKAKAATVEKIRQYLGREIKNLGDDSIIATFQFPKQAVSCALDIHRHFMSKLQEGKHPAWDISFGIGLSGGQPVTEDDGLFKQAINLAHHLSIVAEDREIIMSSLLEKLYHEKSALEGHPHIRILNEREEQFLMRFFNITEAEIANQEFKVEDISRQIGVSRPQLYRKITALTGRSPISFIRDVKMKKALSLLMAGQGNVSEIAFGLGYSNPSYFAKCFHNKYGVSPSKVVM